MIRIFNHYFHKRSFIQVLFETGLIFFVVLASALLQPVGSQILAVKVMVPFLLLSFAMMAINSSLGFNQPGHIRTLPQTSARAFLAFVFAMPVIAVASLQLPNSRAFDLTLGAVVAMIFAIRVYVAHSKPLGMLSQRVLIFGVGQHAKSVASALKKSDPNAKLVGYYASPNETTSDVSTRGIFSRKRALKDIVMEEQIDEIVVALNERRGGSLPMRELLDCKLQGVRVIDVATHFERTLGQIRLESISAGWLIFGDGFTQKNFVRAGTKRVLDIVFSTALILLTWPIMLITALLILVESGGPILYLQERVGLNGRLFTVIKFRSMRSDAESDGVPRWALADDERVTRVGGVIRKLRIDELPQLFSVLLGTMSLVGPRPERPFFVDRLTEELPYFAVRQSVKPGVTGWAQVRYQYGASIEDATEKLQYDLYYVKNQSLFLDLIVLFETIGVVLTRRGAQ